MRRLQIEALPFEGPVATRLRSVPVDGHRTVATTIGERLSDPLTRENWSEVCSRAASPFKKTAGFGTLRLYLVLSEAPRSFNLIEPRDQSHANRWCVRKKHASERPV